MDESNCCLVWNLIFPPSWLVASFTSVQRLLACLLSTEMPLEGNDHLALIYLYNKFQASGFLSTLINGGEMYFSSSRDKKKIDVAGVSLHNIPIINATFFVIDD